MKIILEILEDGRIVYIDTDHLNELAQVKGNPAANTGKTILEHIKEDIANGTDNTGHAKYRKILQHHKILTSQELFTWRQKLSVTEKDLVATS